MLQQTPVARVLPVYEAWIGALADAGRPRGGAGGRGRAGLGPPRLPAPRPAAARGRHRDRRPPRRASCRRRTTTCCALPGVGDYTAAAVASFAFGSATSCSTPTCAASSARSSSGVEFPAGTVTRAERELARRRLLPDDEETAATWSVAVMELGALVCTAGSPRCGRCPVADLCAWRAAGYPAYDGPPRRGQAWTAPTVSAAAGCWRVAARQARRRAPRRPRRLPGPSREQRERCLASLVPTGSLVAASTATRYALPVTRRQPTARRPACACADRPRRWSAGSAGRRTSAGASDLGPPRSAAGRAARTSWCPRR